MQGTSKTSLARLPGRTNEAVVIYRKLLDVFGPFQRR